MAVVDRKTLSLDKLNAWLTQEIQKVEFCADASLKVRYRLAEPDENGCNWSGLIVNQGSNLTADQAAAIATAIGNRAYALFNLAD